MDGLPYKPLDKVETAKCKALGVCLNLEMLARDRKHCGTCVVCAGRGFERAMPKTLIES